jgi:hypothetical protein
MQPDASSVEVSQSISQEEERACNADVECESSSGDQVEEPLTLYAQLGVGVNVRNALVAERRQPFVGFWLTFGHHTTQATTAQLRASYMKLARCLLFFCALLSDAKQLFLLTFFCFSAIAGSGTLTGTRAMLLQRQFSNPLRTPGKASTYVMHMFSPAIFCCSKLSALAAAFLMRWSHMRSVSPPSRSPVRR